MKECVCRTCGKKGENWKEREKRAKEEKEEAEAFKRGDGRPKPKISLARMDELCRIYGMSYGKLEDAIRNGKIYVE